MKIVIAPDSFKESLDAITAAESIAAGMRRVLPDAQYELVPMADGGEGTVEAIVTAHQGIFAEAEVLGPLSRCVTARYGIVDGDFKFVISSRDGVWNGRLVRRAREEVDLTAAAPQVVADLRKRLNALREEVNAARRPESRQEISEKGREKLRALGYIERQRGK